MSRLRPLLWAITVGTALGLTNSLANVFGSPYTPHRLRTDGIWLLQLMAAVLGTTWAWAAGAFVCGWAARRWWHGPLLGVVGMWCADLAYYLSDWLGGITDEIVVYELQYWAVLGTAAGAGMGLLAGLARTRTPWSILASLLASAVLWNTRQGAGAEVVIEASSTTQKVLTLAFLAVLTAWWAAGRRRTDPHQADHADPEVGAPSSTLCE